jgi:hypothetical protein
MVRYKHVGLAERPFCQKGDCARGSVAVGKIRIHNPPVADIYRVILEARRERVKDFMREKQGQG